MICLDNVTVRTELDVQDSDASGGAAILAYASTDRGNNLNWNFNKPAVVSIATADSSITSPAWVAE